MVPFGALVLFWFTGAAPCAPRLWLLLLVGLRRSEESVLELFYVAGESLGEG